MLKAFRSPAAATARTLHTIGADSLCWRAGAASLLFGSSPSSSLDGHSISIMSNCWCLLSRLSAHSRRCPARDERDPLRDELLQVMFNHFLALKGEKITLGKMQHLLETSKVQQGLPQARWLMVVNRMERVVSSHLHEPVGEISEWKHCTNSELQHWPGSLQCSGCNHLYDIFILFSYYLTIRQPHCSSAAQGKQPPKKSTSPTRGWRGSVLTFTQNFLFLHENSVLSVWGAWHHSIHCNPPLAQPAPSPAQKHFSEQIVFAHHTLFFSLFVLLSNFWDISEDIKLQQVYFIEKKTEAHRAGFFFFFLNSTKGSRSYPLDVWSVLFHGNFFHCAFKAKKWLDVERCRLFKASPLFILRVNLSPKTYAGLDGSRYLTLWQGHCPSNESAV